MDNYFINQGIRHVYVSSSLKHLKDRFIKKYGLEEISSKNKKDCNNLIVFGLYTDKDRIVYKMFRNINKYVIFGGNDLFGSKRKLNIKLIKDTRPIMVYSISEDIKNKLDEVNIINTTLNFNLIDTEIFNIEIDKSKSNKIYIYNGLANNLNKDNREQIYGKEYYEEVMKRLPQYEYVISNKKYYSYEEMPKVYSECFIGLRLTKNDGNANMVQEMKQMNIPVVHNSSDYGLKWKTVDDIIKHIKNNDRNNNEIIIDSNKNYLVICVDMKLSRIAGDTIWCSGLINKYLKKYDKIALITSSEDNENFIKNIEDINKLRIIVIKNDKNIIEYINKNNEKIKKIIIRNNDLLKYIKNEVWLDKTILYGLDINLEIIKQITNYKNIWTQSEKLKQLYIDNGIKDSLIKIKEPQVYKYNFDIPERDDKEIRLIYCGTLREEENILEIIEEFKKIHKEKSEVVLKIVYGKIIGNYEFKNKINQIIKEGVDGITFKYNLSHREANYEIATSDIGICWRKDGWGDNGEISTKIREYELYGLTIITNNFDLNLNTNILYFDKSIDKLLINYDKKYLINGNFEIMYIINNSLPFISGYTVRSEKILNTIKNKYNIITFVKPKNKKYSNIYFINNNIYYHYHKRKTYYLFLKEYIKNSNIKILWSGSDNFNGILCGRLKNKLKLKSIYEIRGFWHYTKKYKEILENKFNKENFLEYDNKEKLSCILNDYILCENNIISKICNNNYNINSNKIYLLENGADSIKKISHIKQKNKIIFGYIGSIVSYEGIENLIKQFQKIDNTKYCTELLIIGGGNTNDALTTIKKIKYLIDNGPTNIKYLGVIDYNNIDKYYDLIDIICLPRINCEVCNIVTPLKPLEAISKGKILLASNVKPITEIITHNFNGILYDKDNIDSLYIEMIKILDGKYNLNNIINNGYEYCKNNTWENKSISLQNIINSIIR
jgi:glycosyltransferase involved in cell wall biosynthesis